MSARVQTQARVHEHGVFDKARVNLEADDHFHIQHILFSPNIVSTFKSLLYGYECQCMYVMAWWWPEIRHPSTACNIAASKANPTGVRWARSTYLAKPFRSLPPSNATTYHTPPRSTHVMPTSAKRNTPCHALQDFYLADALPHQ